jgi:hypothetical protein
MGVYTPGGTHSNQEAGVVVNGLLRLFSNEDSGGYAAIIFGSGDSNYSTTLSKSGLQVPGNTGDFAFNIDTTDGLFKFQSGYGTALTIKPSAYNTGTGILISGSAPSAVTQTAAVTGLSLNQSTNFTVPNSSAGNQTGINLTIKDGGASATSKGISIQGTADTGISFGGTITNLIDATNFKVSSLGVATLGSANQAGSLVINDGTSSTVTIKSGTQVAATNYDITIPAITGSDIICLQSFANCGGASVWIDGTANAYLSVSSDWVGIGTSTPTDKLNVLASTSGSTSFDGLQIDFTQDDDADSADTNAGLNINITSSSSDQDTVLGINIANITGGSAFERGLQIGSGWDSNLYFNDTTTNISIANSGTFTFNDGTNTLFSIVDTGTNADLIITGGVTFAAFTNGGLGCSALETTATGALNCGTDDTTGGSAPGWTDGGFNVYLSTLNDLVGIGTTTPTDKLNILASTSGSAAFDGLQIDFTLSSDGDSADNNAGLNINLTQSSSDADVLNGISISIAGASTSARERGISIGTGFDDDIYFASASATLRIQSGGQIAITDNFIGGGASSDLPLARLKEYFSDANFGVWEAGGFINLDGSYRMDNFINPGSASADISGASKLGDNQDWVVDEAATGAGGTATQQVGCQVGVGGGNTNLTYGTSNQLNGVMYMKLDSNSVTNTPNTWCAMYHADTAGSNATRMAQLNAANKFIMYYKVRPDSNYTATNTPSNNNLFFWLGANQHTQGYFGKSTLTSNNNLIAFTNLNGTQTQTGTNATAGTVWNGWVQNGTAATNISTVSCSNANISTATNAWALMRIEARATNDVHFFIDGDVSNGVSLSECGGGITSNIPTGMLRPQIMAAQNGGTVTVTRGLFVDLFAFVQDDVRDGTTPQQALSTDAELANTTQEIPDIMGGADLAEHYYVPEGQEIHPGEIVSLGNYAGQVNKSTRPYDRKLLGVVSESPGLEIGQAAANSVPVALTGRVSVKVNGSGGAIKIGDPITPSLISGEGMKATEAGKILGTAMEAYTAEGSGTIMVNVNVGYYLGDELGLEQNDEIGFGQSELASGCHRHPKLCL